jgi:transposase
MVAAYRHADDRQGRQLMESLIASLTTGVPAVLTEVATIGRTLKKRSANVLAYFDRPGTSNGPTEVINGRLEHLAAPPSAYGTSPTTSPDHSSRPEDSDPGYTLHCEEPLCLLRSV